MTEENEEAKMARDEKEAVDRQQDNNYGGCTGKGWIPGQSGNPAGRPPNKRYLSELARDILKTARKGDLEGKTTDELVVLALVKEALKGNTKAIEMLHDWTEGKVADTHKIEGDVPVSIVYKPVEGKDATK